MKKDEDNKYLDWNIACYLTYFQVKRLIELTASIPLSKSLNSSVIINESGKINWFSL